MARSIEIAIKDGTATVRPRWTGQHLAVTPPIKDGAELACRGQWVITHTATGFSCATLLCNLKKATEVAKSWDDKFGLIKTSADTLHWPHRMAWGDLVTSVNCPSINLGGPDESDAIAATLAREAGCKIDRDGADRRIMWRGQWRHLPTDTELELWVMDSVCETPDGRIVEPDHPESWLSILNLI
jgi:hypothetical protein